MAIESSETPISCPRCGQTTHAAIVKTAIWRDESLFVVEDIPAQVCDGCMEQFYDEDTTDALRRLMEDRPAEPAREVTVQIFSLKGRVQRRKPDPEGTYADY